MRSAEMKELIDIDRQIKSLQGEIDELKERRGVLEKGLLENMVNDGVQRVTLDGATVYVRRELWAGAGQYGMPALVRALKQSGLDEFVTEAAGAQRLSAWVREHDPEKSTPPEDVIARLPELVRPYIKVSEKFGLHVVKAA